MAESEPHNTGGDCVLCYVIIYPLQKTNCVLHSLVKLLDNYGRSVMAMFDFVGVESFCRKLGLLSTNAIKHVQKNVMAVWHLIVV
jgi:hypothetical protein